MKIIFKHPGKSSYHDNGIFVRVVAEHEGFWLMPGQHIAVVTDAEAEKAEKAEAPADPGPEWDEFCLTHNSREWTIASVRQKSRIEAMNEIRDAEQAGWISVGYFHKVAGTWVQYMKKAVGP